MVSKAKKVRVLLFAALACTGALLSFSPAPASFAARVKLGPLEVETDPPPPREKPAAEERAEKLSPVTEVEVKTSEEGEEGDTEKKALPPYEVKSISPRPFPEWEDETPLVYHAHMSDVVDLGIGPFLERVIEEARSEGAVAVIIEIDTPGGRVDAAVEIKDVLLRSEVPTIAFVNKQAISAGALIAFAHDYIIWSTGATMGAATPIQMGGEGGAEPVEEKMTSYMRGVMRATAEAKERDGFIAECMVDADMELPGFAEKGKLLTAAHKQAEELGLLDGTAESLEEVLKLVGLENAEVRRPELSWGEKTARFLTHPIVSSVLMSLGMLGIIIEFYTPGFGIAGIAGALALFLFFAGHLAVNLAGMEELLLFLGGCALLIVEVYFIPGFGIAGLAGFLLLAISLVLALVELGSGVSFTLAGEVLAEALFRFCMAVIATGGIFFLLLRFLPKSRYVSRLFLTSTLSVEEGYVASPVKGAASILGAPGVALTDLRPTGRARIAGKKYDVTASSQFVTRGESVVVLGVDGPTISVERSAAEPKEDKAE